MSQNTPPNRHREERKYEKLKNKSSIQSRSGAAVRRPSLERRESGRPVTTVRKPPFGNWRAATSMQLGSSRPLAVGEQRIFGGVEADHQRDLTLGGRSSAPSHPPSSGGGGAGALRAAYQCACSFGVREADAHCRQQSNRSWTAATSSELSRTPERSNPQLGRTNLRRHKGASKQPGSNKSGHHKETQAQTP